MHKKEEDKLAKTKAHQDETATYVAHIHQEFHKMEDKRVAENDESVQLSKTIKQENEMLKSKVKMLET